MDGLLPGVLLLLQGLTRRPLEPRPLRLLVPDEHAVDVVVSLLWASSCFTTSSGSSACLNVTSSMDVDMCLMVLGFIWKASRLKKLIGSLDPSEEVPCCSAAADVTTSTVEAAPAHVATQLRCHLCCSP